MHGIDGLAQPRIGKAGQQPEAGQPLPGDPGPIGAEVKRGGIGDDRDARPSLPPTHERTGAIPFEERDEPTAIAFINRIVDSGINYIDTSIDYGRSERLIGESIAGRRSEYFLASKCGCVPGAPIGTEHLHTAANIRAGVEASLRLLSRVSEALGFAHAQGIIHSDIKPQNILVDTSSHILKLCDFGSAKQLIKGEANVSYICSRYYRAPELIFGNSNYGPYIDVWSVGCVIAELMLGQPIFPGESGVD